MAADIDRVLQHELLVRKQQSLFRQREVVEDTFGVRVQCAGGELLSFCSNDYLGLAEHPRVKEAFLTASNKYGVGAKASHLVNGHSIEHHLLEEEIAEFTGRERAVLFSTGYMANMGVIAALARRGDVIYEDKLNHASLLDGGILSAAELVRYNHNDIEHLEKRLRKYGGKRKLIVVDGVFSMDGDFANLAALKEVALTHNAWLMVDDAHGIGCVGQGGRGSLAHFSLTQEDVPILVGTLGKAVGTFGAFVAGSHALIETLIQFSRTYIYTTALPPAIAAATRESLKIIAQDSARRMHLQKVIRVFREACVANGLELMASTTPIQPILLNSAERALAISAALKKQGFWVSAIRPPTVPAGTSRLRITLNAEHSREQVESLVLALTEAVHGPN